MAKTDFKRVENALEEGLRRMSVSRLVEHAGTTGNPTKGEASTRQRRQRSAEQSLKRAEERRMMATKMQFDINQLFKKDHSLYTTLGTYHDEITDLFKRADTLQDQEWERLQAIKGALDAYKQQHRQQEEQIADDDLVAKERKFQVNDRYNVKRGWLPLH